MAALGDGPDFKNFYFEIGADADDEINSGDSEGAADFAFDSTPGVLTNPAGNTWRVTDDVTGVTVGRTARIVSDENPIDVLVHVTVVDGGNAYFEFESDTDVLYTGNALAEVNVKWYVGGAWGGPAGEGTPGRTAGNALRDWMGRATTVWKCGNDHVRFNVKAHADKYNPLTKIVSGANFTSSVWLIMQGYTSTIGDLGRATIEGTASGYGVDTGHYYLMFVDLIVENAGNRGFEIHDYTICIRCTADTCGAGFYTVRAYSRTYDCEAVDCTDEGFHQAGSNLAMRGNRAYNNATGIFIEGGGAFPRYNAILQDCVVYGNTAFGVEASVIPSFIMVGNTIYDNDGGLVLLTAQTTFIEFRNNSIQKSAPDAPDYNFEEAGLGRYFHIIERIGWNQYNVDGGAGANTDLAGALGPHSAAADNNQYGAAAWDAGGDNFEPADGDTALRRNGGPQLVPNISGAVTATYPTIGASEPADLAGGGGGRVTGGMPGVW